MFPLKGEPAVIVGIVVAVLTAVQQAALPISQDVHTIIAIALVAAGALVTRTQVAPLAAGRRTSVRHKR